MKSFDIKERAKAINGKIVEWRRHIHANPELGMELPKTEAFVARNLKEMGVEKIRQGVAGHGITALIEGEKPGKILGIRADMDALNMAEDTGLPFAAKNGWMHACGHDAHTAMLLGAAEMLMQRRDELKGSVKLIFQPSEEDGAGAAAMIREGVMDDPKVDAIIGLHTGNLWKGAAAGEIGYRFGPMMAAVDWVTATFNGKGGHGATPHLTIDPISIACQAQTILQTIVSREVSPTDSAILSICMIQGGTAANVIAPSCTMKGTLRSLTPEGRKYLQDRFTQVCEDTARAMRGSAAVEVVNAPPALINDRDMTEKLRTAAADIVGAGHVHEIHEPSMGGEDMAFFLEKAPGTFFYLPATFGDERDFPHHHPKFNLNEDVFWIGSAAFVQFALTWQIGR
ncbi:MAG: M20 family metallopeptidase [Synergistaceae bacterium]|nr:M20 family metallopeptidase [Synergistaceae bacterium]